MPWYYVEDGQQAGPVSEGEFEALVASGRVSSETLVWKEGMESWQPYSQVQQGAAVAAVAPPVSSFGQSPLSGGFSSDYGSTAAGGMVQCNECGRYFGEDQVIRYGTMNVCAACKPGFVQRIKEGGRVSGTLDYAGFWIRFGARFIDNLIIGAASMLLSYLAGLVMGNPVTIQGLVGQVTGMSVLFTIIAIGYEAFMLFKFGATPGKLALRLKVVTPDGDTLNPKTAVARSAWYQGLPIIPILGGLVVLIGCIMAASDEEKRALHDRVCGTRVVRV